MLALSWSRINTYLQCPLKFNLQFISKSFKEEEKGIHLVKGEQLHKQMEEYVLAKNGQMKMPLGFSPEVQQSIPYVDKLFTMFDAIHPEAQVAADINWTTCEWFGKETAWRAIWDVVGLAPKICFIGDYKSGKVYPYGNSFGQLDLSAVMAMKRFSDVPRVTSAYVYLEHKKVITVKLTREPTDEKYEDGRSVPHLQQAVDHFEAIFDRVQNETLWAPTPNEFCKWCPATKAQCKFSRKL